MTEFQPRTSFAVTGVDPGPGPERGDTGLRLPGGKTRPFHYSLSTRSTVPYVQFLGSGNSQKVFGWNELIEVPPGEMVSVFNASAHGGDIVINAGADQTTAPARVTIPVPVIDNAAQGFWEAEWPVDTRRARRAFVAGIRNPQDGVTDILVGATHQANGSFLHNPDAVSGGGEGSISQVISQQRVDPDTQPSLVPLGINAGYGDDLPHALLDQVSLIVSPNDPDVILRNGAILVVLEYL